MTPPAVRPYPRRTTVRRLVGLCAVVAIAAVALPADAQRRAPGPAETASAPTPWTPAPPASDRVVRPGTAILSDADAAARVRRSTWEPRSQNTDANRSLPSSAELQAFRENGNHWGPGERLRRKVTGNFKGTTDEIIQWAAAKWGLPADIVRAVAVQETYWRGDFVGDNGRSFGLMQIKESAHRSTRPASETSTAFNVDYYGATIRFYYDGLADWMHHQRGGGSYARGDVWGSIGAWYTGHWHDSASRGYVARVKQTLKNRTWLQQDF